MNRFIAAFLLTVLLIASVPAQVSSPTVPTTEIDTFLELLDAIDAAQESVLSNPGAAGAEELADLRELVAIAETFGADDLAARARSLIVLASFGGAAAPPALAPVQGDLAGDTAQPVARDTAAFRRWVNVGATAGATALGMSTMFAYLAERYYQEWTVETDPGRVDELYQAWRGYDLLAFGLGGVTLVSVGVGLPLVFALTPPSGTLATPPEAEIFTPAGREQELQRLYEERLGIVEKLGKLNARERRRSIVRTVGLGAGAGGTIAAVTFFYAAEQTYDRYLVANGDDALSLGRRVSLFDGLAVGSAVIAGAGFGTAATMEVITPSRAELSRELEQVNAAIIRVRGSRTMDAPDPEPEPESQSLLRRIFSRRNDEEESDTGAPEGDSE